MSGSASFGSLVVAVVVGLVLVACAGSGSSPPGSASVSTLTGGTEPEAELDWASAMVECLAEWGIPAERSADGGVRFGEIAPDQADTQRAAIDECRRLVPVGEESGLGFGEARLEALYGYLVGPLRECLEGEGYEIGDPPTLEAFIESFRTPGAVPWHPYAWVDPATPGEWDRINRLCPQDPAEASGPLSSSPSP